MAIFSLNEVRTEQIKNIANDNFESWPESVTYGYFGGGNDDSPPYVTTVDRIDFSNETFSAPGNNLTQARGYIAAVSSSSYGYFGGGNAAPEIVPEKVTTVDRIDFSNETTSAPGTYNLTQERIGLAAVSSSSYGYFGGGEAPPEFLEVATVDRLDFSNETFSAPGTYNLTEARHGLAATSSSLHGYFGGGFSPGPTYHSTVDRLDFSNETTSAPGTYNLPQARRYLAGTESNSYGYFGGGFAPPYVDTVDRIDFSNETTSAPGDNLPQARSTLAAVSSSSYGYFGGGFAPPDVDLVDRIDFSNETVSDIGDLPQARYGLAAVSGGASYRIKGSRTYGYFAGGLSVPSVVFNDLVDRIDFSNETVSDIGDLTQARYGLAAVSSSSYGYFCYTDQTPDSPEINATVDRLDFSNETFSAPGNDLPQARTTSAAVSTSSYGYFGAGLVPPQIKTVDRLDFSNETTSAPSNDLPQARNGLAAVSSSSYGYFGGGINPDVSPAYVDTVDRIDFSNETTSAPGNNLSQGRSSLAAVSSSSYSYFAGGSNPAVSPAYVDTVDRIDFSNETRSLPGDNLPQGRSRLAATSSDFYGYFGAGFNSPGVDTVERLDFSNETFSLAKNNLSKARWYLAAVSN